MALKNVTLSSIEEADAFVSKTRNARWENYDILVFTPSDRGFAHKRGTFDRKTQRWGFTYRHPVTSDGKWNVKVHVRGSK